MDGIRKIVCYGDSNTYGYNARSFFGERFDESVIWTTLLAGELGVKTVNCGVNGQSIPASANALAAELAALRQHLPFEALTVMLGSNDAVSGIYAGAEQIAEKMRSLLTALRSLAPECRILLIAPPRAHMTPEAEAITAALPAYYRALAGELGIDFADCSQWGLELDWDGMHLTEEDHRRFAGGVLHAVRGIWF